jgi:acetylornithine deacetylase/succinyl-diaminopimelate desuccinylase-like protein
MMNFFNSVKNSFLRGVNSLSGRMQFFFHQPKKSAAPLADRLLADALLLGEIPSPTEREEERAVFVVERLSSLSIPHTIDGEGNILVRLHGRGGRSAEPLLLFTGLGSERWNSFDSLGHLDTRYAKGAGLADALGPAALLSVAESHNSGRSFWERDIILLFSVFGFDDPSKDAFLPFAEARQRPFAALGIRGFSLGSIFTPAQGSYRVEIKLSRETEEEQKKAEERKKHVKVPEAQGKNTDAAGDLTRTLVNLASGYLEKNGETEGDLSINIRRIEARTVYDRVPLEGTLELDLESSSREKLDGALEKIKADTEKYNTEGLVSSLQVLSSIPPADPARCGKLAEILEKAAKGLKIKPAEHSEADPSSFLVNMGIPALSIGLAGGRAGVDHDTVEIATVEMGRLLLERCIELVTGEEQW